MLADEANELEDQVQSQSRDISQLLTGINQLEHYLFSTGNVIKTDTYYWSETDIELGGPFCPKCYEKDNTFHFITQITDEKHVCTNCKSKFFEKPVLPEVTNDKLLKKLEHEKQFPPVEF